MNEPRKGRKRMPKRIDLERLDRASPAVVVRFETLDRAGKAVLVRIDDDDEVGIWIRGDSESVR